MKKKWDALWHNGLMATCDDKGMITQGVIGITDGKIAWVGDRHELPDTLEHLSDNLYDLQGCCLTPGFIDCHTHAIFAGNRMQEHAWRLQGKTYEEIAHQGGGIQSTVIATRVATEASLFQQSIKRIIALMKSGVTTLEIKSGYGLDIETEIKILKVAQQIEKILPLTICKTFLGAHSVPCEYAHDKEGYVDLICEQMIPRIAKEKLADAIDVFCENIAFNLAQTERVFKTAQIYGLPIKCHAEQLGHSESVALAAFYQALSVDHLEYASEQGIKAIATSGTVAVLLPGAYYFLRETKLPPINLLRQYKVPIAIATDCNPGTSPVLSLPLILNMACNLFKLTPEEALLGVTKHAAMALGLEKTHGTLKEGKVADFAIWDVHHPNELAYYVGGNFLRELVKNGERILTPSH